MQGHCIYMKLVVSVRSLGLPPPAPPMSSFNKKLIVQFFDTKGVYATKRGPAIQL